MINKSRWLDHIHLFLEIAMKEGIVDVEFPHVPPLRHGEGEKDTDCAGLHHRAEGVVVVDAVTLLESLGNKTSFEVLNGAIGIVLDLEDPTAIDEVDAWRGRNKTPSLIAVQGCNFSIHGSLPARVLQRGVERGRLQIICTNSSVRDKIWELLGLRDATA